MLFCQVMNTQYVRLISLVLDICVDQSYVFEPVLHCLFDAAQRSVLGRGGGRVGGGALQDGGPLGCGGRDPVGDGGGSSVCGSGLYVLPVKNETVDGGGVVGRGGRVEVGNGGIWSSSDHRHCWCWGRV